MTTVRDIFTAYGQAYLQAFGDRLPANHREVIQAIAHCRTPMLGSILCRCEDCGKSFEIYKSCGNRHCPTCQSEKANLWLGRRLDQLLPVHHFMITFTVPAAFRDFIRSHQRFAYPTLFKASSQTLKRLGSESTYFEGDTPGFFGVLHTWGRQMQYHPHIHYIVPGGAFSSQDHSWHPSSQAFYLPVRIMAKLVKASFFKMMKKADLLHLIPRDAWKQDWNVNSRAVGNGVRSVRYLSAYVFRTAISDSRILKIEHDQVLFRYTDTKSGTAKTLRLSAFEFIRRFLQHVLPPGFMKIRYYGFLHPSSHIPLKLAVTLLEAWSGVRARDIQLDTDRSGGPFCPECSGPVRLLYFLPPRTVVPAAAGFS
jgi:hypothetical protein